MSNETNTNEMKHLAERKNEYYFITKLSDGRKVYYGGGWMLSKKFATIYKSERKAINMAQKHGGTVNKETI